MIIIGLIHICRVRFQVKAELLSLQLNGTVIRIAQFTNLPLLAINLLIKPVNSSSRTNNYQDHEDGEAGNCCTQAANLTRQTLDLSFIV